MPGSGRRAPSTSIGRPARTSCSMDERNRGWWSARFVACSTSISERRSHPSAAATSRVSRMMPADIRLSSGTAAPSDPLRRVSADTVFPAAFEHPLRQTSRRRSAGISAPSPLARNSSTADCRRGLVDPSGSPINQRLPLTCTDDARLGNFNGTIYDAAQRLLPQLRPERCRPDRAAAAGRGFRAGRDATTRVYR